MILINVDGADDSSDEDEAALAQRALLDALAFTSAKTSSQTRSRYRKLRQHFILEVAILRAAEAKGMHLMIRNTYPGPDS